MLAFDPADRPAEANPIGNPFSRDPMPTELIRNALKRFVFRTYYAHKRIEFKNREGLSTYDFALQPGKSHRPGVSAMLRIKNEASRIHACLLSIVDLFDEIIVVNNGSTDATRAIVETFIADHRCTHIKLFDYPHAIARCGSENEETSETSVHSLAYFYNWCLAQCSRSWVFKWDGDMLLPDRSRADAQRILAQIQRTGLRLWNIRGQAVYIDAAGMAWASKSEINHEERVFPNSAMVYYRKEKLWERLKAPFTIQEEYPDEILFYEIKDTREDEFSHWTDTSQLSPRKQIEYSNYMLVQRSSPPPADQFTPITLERVHSA